MWVLNHEVFSTLLAITTGTFFSITNSYAQTVFDDVEGRSTFILPVGAVIGVNTGEPNIEIGYYKLTNTDNWFYGASIQAFSKEGIGPVFGDGEFRPAVGFNSALGYKSNGKTYIALRGLMNWFQTSLLNSSLPTPSVEEQTQKGWEVGLHLTKMLNNRIGFSTSVGRRTVDNYSDLNKITFNTVSIIENGDSSYVNLTRSVETRQGDFKQMEISYFDFDVLTIVSDGVSFRPFGRFILTTNDERITKNSVGFDLAIFGSDPLLDRQFGIVFQVFDNLPDEDKSLIERIEIAFNANLVTLYKLIN